LKKTCLGLLATVIACGCGGSKASQRTPPPVLTGSIAGAAMACAQTPLPTKGTIYYACDCGSGADPGCQAGSDSNPGTSPDKPWQTYKKAQAQFAALAAGDTIAFCKGGSFTGNKNAWVNASCRADNVCTVRDYTPSWAGSSTAMPKLVGGAMSLANDAGALHEEGYQFLNLEFDGPGSGDGLFIYNDIKDVLVCNVVLNNFENGINAESAQQPGAGSDGLNARITVRGSQIINNSNMGWLGACSGCNLEFNYFDHNGGNSPTEHAIYYSGQMDASGKSVTPVGEQIIGNEVHHSAQGSGTSCGGTIFVVHGLHDQMLIEGNLIAEDEGTAQEGCWGISLAPEYNTAEGFTNVTILGNTVVNVGNAPIEVESCQNCVIEDNLVIDDDAYGSGILVHPTTGSGQANDLTLQAVQVLNNTVYQIGTEGVGITVGGQGTNHVVAGNAVVGTGSNQWSCFSFDLAASAYYSDHNLCWDAAYGSAGWNKDTALAGWQSKTGLDAHSLYADPLFKNAADSGYDFTALAGSPLIGAGDPTHGSTVDIAGKTRPSPPDIGAYQN
jgi:hypothetical protein